MSFALVILIFLYHFRSALVPITVPPVAIVISSCRCTWFEFLPTSCLWGACSRDRRARDASIVMVENAHRHLAAVDPRKERRASRDPHASQQVGGQSSFSLVIIVISFLPVFLLPARGAALPSARFHEDFAIAAASILSSRSFRFLMMRWMRGRIRTRKEIRSRCSSGDSTLRS